MGKYGLHRGGFGALIHDRVDSRDEGIEYLSFITVHRDFDLLSWLDQGDIVFIDLEFEDEIFEIADDAQRHLWRDHFPLFFVEVVDLAIDGAGDGKITFIFFGNLKVFAGLFGKNIQPAFFVFISQLRRGIGGLGIFKIEYRFFEFNLRAEVLIPEALLANHQHRIIGHFAFCQIDIEFEFIQLDLIGAAVGEGGVELGIFTIEFGGLVEY